MGLSTVIVLQAAPGVARFRRRWERWEPSVLRRLGPVELVAAEGAAQAEQAAHEAALSGFRRLIVAGDLLTAHGVVNGLMRLAESHRRAIKVGFLSLAAPDVWCRALGLPADIERQLEILSAAHVVPYDVGRLECLAADGQPLIRHFLTGAALGRAGAADRPADVWLRPVTMAIVGLRDHLRNRFPDVRLICDDGEVYRGPWLLGWAMQSSRYPGAGEVAPAANPADGALEVRWIGGRGPGTVASLAGLACGWPVGLRAASTRELHLDVDSGTIAVEADGVPLGRAPVRIAAVPRTLPVIVEAVASRLREKQKALLEEARGAALAGGLERATRG